VEAEGRAGDEHNPLLFYMVLVARPTRSRSGMTSLLAFKFVLERVEEIIILDVPVFSGLFKIIICGARDFPYYLMAIILFLELTAISFGLGATAERTNEVAFPFACSLLFIATLLPPARTPALLAGGRVREKIKKMY
jgi:hypothetical protein